MAKFSSTTFGKISAKHGTAVASERNGKSILSVYNPPRDPKTDKQLATRKAFGLVNSGLNPLRNPICFGFGGQQGFYLATSLAFKHAITGTYPDLRIDYSQIIISSGSLPQAVRINLVKMSDTLVSFQWDTSFWMPATELDRVHIVVLNVSKKFPMFLQSITSRSAGAIENELPSVWAGDEIHAWIFFTSPNDKFTSISQYMGTITM